MRVSRLAFVEAARETLLAAFLVDERGLSAFFAQVTHPPEPRLTRWRRCVLPLTQPADMFRQRSRERIGKGENPGCAETGRLPASDALQLVDHLFQPSLCGERRPKPPHHPAHPAQPL